MLYLPLGQWSPNRYPASVAKRPFESIDEHTTHNWAESAEYSSLLFCQFIDFYAVVLCRENHDGSIRTDFIDGAHNRIHAAIFSLRVVIDAPAAKEDEGFRRILIHISRFALATCGFLKKHLTIRLFEPTLEIRI